MFNYFKKISYFLFFLVFSSFGMNCSPPPVEEKPCQGTISDKSIDTSGKKCQRRCDCNNQKYSGYCLKGICHSFLREACSKKGAVRSCLLPPHLIIKKCTKGTQVCQAQGLKSKVWGDCSLAPPVSNEGNSLFCFDGIDNDCDGKIDSEDPDCKNQCIPGKEESCYSGQPQEIGVGICKAGKRHCSEDGHWGPCQGEVLPKKEICNHLDDDCDGRLNNGVPNCQKFCQKGETRPCFSGKSGCIFDPKSKKYRCTGACGAGIQHCSAQGFFNTPCLGEILPKAEDCDGVDNDCDGQTDEGENGKQLERACYTSLKGCRKESNGRFSCTSPCRPGRQICHNGEWSSCKGQKLPTNESCDGIDNDCDGQIDENIPPQFCYTGPTGTVGLGECKAGQKRCLKGHWTACRGEVHPKPEVCGDGKDNNCNGQTDEGC